MSFWDFLYRLLIYPLELIFEVIYTISEKYIQNPGLSIIVLSLVMNILVLPLYMKADRLQEEAREKESRLAPAVRRIRETFKGDERFMMLSAYYRENDYSPLSSLKGSLSLLLEIPFFISAYHFLSNLGYIRGVSLGPLKDLGSPDGLIVIGSVTLNLLPVLMTLINIISSYIYAKDFPKKTKIQLYVIAGIFLVLLYNSPSGLVFYWVLNNLFSLFKNVFYKIRHSRTVLGILSMCTGICLSIASFNLKDMKSEYQWILFITGLAFFLPGLFAVIGKYIVIKDKNKIFSPEDPAKDRKIFTLCCIFMAFFTGIETTAELIATSFQDLLSINNYVNPFCFVLSASATSIGLFVIWAGVFYSLSGNYGKRIMSILIWILSTTAVLNKVITKYSGTGFFRPSVAYETPLSYNDDLMLYMVMLLSIVTISYIFWGNIKRAVILISFVGVFTMVILSGYYGYIAFRAGQNAYYLDESKYAVPADLKLSQNGKNVIVIMLDREVSEFIPAIMTEYPETEKAFDGFVYYPNTVSLGNATIVGAPGLLGGYEYIPEKMNERNDVSMEDKINQANLLLPVMFENNGFESLVCDPPYAGNKIVPDLSVFDEYDIDAVVTNGAFSYDYELYETNADDVAMRQMRNFFCYSLLRVSPVFLWDVVYDDGNYNYLGYHYTNSTFAFDTNEFANAYYILCNLKTMADIKENGNYYTYIGNMTTHEPIMLWEDDHNGVLVSGEEEYDLSNSTQISYYQINSAALYQLGSFFEYLQDEGIYDNTRIIIVSDHSCDLGYQGSVEGAVSHVQTFHCSLMVKDFDSHGHVRTDNTKMTNADVPLIATEGLIEDRINPFTGNSIEEVKENYGDNITVFYSTDWNPFYQKTYSLSPGDWFRIKGDDLLDVSNWEYLGNY